MNIEERTDLAANVVNCTLAINDLPLEIENRLRTLLILLDESTDEELASAVEEAHEYMASDAIALC